MAALRRLALPLVLAALLMAVTLGLVLAQEPITGLIRVTTNSHSDRDSEYPSISADGRWVAFYSDSDFLSEGRPNDIREIWLHDRQNVTLTRVTSASHTNRDSYEPSVSGDGRWIAFRSNSDFLGEGRPAGIYEIWLYDRQNLTFTRVTSASHTSRESIFPDISADGRWLAFESDSDFLGEGRPLDHQEIWLYDRRNVTFTRVTSASHTDRDSDNPSISGDGKYVAFHSDSDFHNQGFGSATGAVVSDTLDPRLEFLGPVTLDPSGAGTPGTPPILASGVTVPAGESVTVTFRAMISKTGVVSGTVIDNTAAVTSSEVSTSTADSVSITVRPRSTYLPTVIK